MDSNSNANIFEVFLYFYSNMKKSTEKWTKP